MSVAVLEFWGEGLGRSDNVVLRIFGGPFLQASSRVWMPSVAQNSDFEQVSCGCTIYALSIEVA